jgi:hypothetical protein
MNRIATIGLAVLLASVAGTGVAHTANYEGECDARVGAGICERNDPQPAAHDRCTGERKWTQADDDSLYKTSIGLGGASDVAAYVHSPPHSGADNQDPTVGDVSMPGVLWIESNGFSDLQKNDFQCKSPNHEDPSSYQVHSDRVII